jgi:NadR type nicotinamide-nucleotide adenylyltransferase
VIASPDRTRGLILGKFLPPHAGHLHVLRTGAALCDELTVLVCTLAREPLDGRLRAGWVRELAATIGPHVHVVHVEDDVPQTPDEHPRFWEIWADLCARHAGRVTLVFSSEEYGEKLARVLGARHHMVDHERRTFPVSGTAARTNPFAVWDMLPPPVRAHYAVRVALVGPESTGKSTLAARLAAAFGTLWVPEYGRDHTARITERTGESSFVGAFTGSDIETIARVQARNEDAAARRANRVLFCDTDLLTTRIWSEIILGECPAAVRTASEARRYGLHLLMDTDIPWLDDGTRRFGAERQAHFGRIRDTLDDLGWPYVVIGGSFEERLARAAGAVQERWPHLTRIDDA